MKRLFLFVMVSVTLLCINCGNQTVAGGGLDTESSGGRLTGAVINSNNAGFAPNTSLQLISQNHSPFSNDTIYHGETNDSGKFTFSKIDTGFYTLEAVHPTLRTRFLKRGIHITENSETKIVPETLKVTGNIVIVLGSQIFSNSSILYIPGTSFSFKLPGGDTLRIDSLPPGIIPPILYSETNGKSIDSITDSITLHSYETVTLPVYKSWTHSMRITIDTHSPASEIKSEIYNFPLLVRLYNTNIDYRTVSASQKDIRFVSSTGKTLPYQIERWDSLGLQTAMWVLLDTIKPDNASQFITMYWGNLNAKAVSNGATVFDSGNGFRAVLHIDEESSGVRNHALYTDATVLANHGDDYINDRGRTGIIGRGKHFNYEQEDFILIDTLNGCSIGTGPFTISVWFKSDYSQKSNLFTWYCDNDSMPFGVSIDSTDSIRITYDTNTVTRVNAPVNSWVHLVLTRSSSQILATFINGKLCSSVPFTKSIGDATGKFFIGSDINVYPGPNLISRSFNGYIDEFRIEAAYRSSDWVKLAYLNQSSALILNFKKLQ